MKKLLDRVLPYVLEVLIKLLPEEKIVKYADEAIDWCEDVIVDSSNDYDDRILLPLLDLIRKAFGLPDNDEVDSKGIDE